MCLQHALATYISQPLMQYISPYLHAKQKHSLSVTYTHSYYETTIRLYYTCLELDEMTDEFDEYWLDSHDV